MTDTALDQLEFRNAMARFPSGVTVVTTRDVDGKPAGFTASAFSSLSLDPPLVLVCLEKRADCYPAFRAALQFSVSFLAADQLDTGMRFASKGVDKFAGVPLVEGPMTGMSLIDGAAVQLECRVHEQLEGGDHTIIVGEVLHAWSDDREPLVHYNRHFGRFSEGG